MSFYECSKCGGTPGVGIGCCCPRPQKADPPSDQGTALSPTLVRAIMIQASIPQSDEQPESVKPSDFIEELARADALRLHLGEMTAQELRTAKAAVRYALVQLDRHFSAQQQEIHDLKTICAEAYQAVGSLSSDCGRFGDDDVQRVLDNLSEQRLVHKDVLPFASKEKPQ